MVCPPLMMQTRCWPLCSVEPRLRYHRKFTRLSLGHVCSCACVKRVRRWPRRLWALMASGACWRLRLHHTRRPLRTICKKMLHDGAASNRCFMVSIVERALSVLDANAVHSPGAADVGVTPTHYLAVLASASRCVSAQAPAPPCAASIGQTGIDSKCLIDDEVMLASLERAAARSEIGGSPQLR